MEILPTIMPTASLQEGSASMASYPATLDSLADESQQQLFSQICKAGDCHPLHFAQQAPTFSPIRTLPKEHTRALLGAIITQHALLVGIQGRISPLQEGGYPTACSLSVCLPLPRGDIQSLTARALWSLWRTYTALPVGKCYLPQPDTCQVPRLDSAITADTPDIRNAQGRGTRALLLRLPIPRAICSEYPSCLSGLLPAGGATVLQRVALLRTLS